MTLNRMRRRIATIALRLYPRAWRDRYGEELVDLVETTDISWWHVAGVAFNGWSERLRGPALVDHSLLGATVRFGRATGLAFVASTFTLIVVFGALLAYASVGSLIWRPGGPDGDWHLRIFWMGMSLVWMGGVYFLWGLVFALPVLLTLLLTGLGRRFPRAARATTVMAFLAFPVLVLGLPRIGSSATLEVRSILAAFVAGWCFALVVFPRSRVEQRVLGVPERVR